MASFARRCQGLVGPMVSTTSLQANAVTIGVRPKALRLAGDSGGRTSAKPIAGCGAGREFAASDRVPETAVGLCRWVLPWGAGALGRWAGMLPSSVVL